MNNNHSATKNKIDLTTFFESYFESLESSYDSQVLCVEGIYIKKGNRSYGDYFYDVITDVNKSIELSVRLSNFIRNEIKDGYYYQFEGIIKRKASNSNFLYNTTFYITKVYNSERAIKLIDEEEFNLIKSRNDHGFINIEMILLEKIRLNELPKIMIITGNNSIVLNDFYNQLNNTSHYDIEVRRTSMTSHENIIDSINDVEDKDLIAIIRGGGSGLNVFNNETLCKSILDKKIPFVTAIGHEVDKPLLERIADRSFATPSSLGTFLNNVVIQVENINMEITQLEHELLRTKSRYEKEHEVLLKNANEEKVLLQSKMESINRSKLTYKTAMIFFICFIITIAIISLLV